MLLITCLLWIAQNVEPIHATVLAISRLMERLRKKPSQPMDGKIRASETVGLKRRGIEIRVLLLQAL